MKAACRGTFSGPSCGRRTEGEVYMSYQKLLVTGGLGFIGSSYIRLLLTEYDDVNVVNLDLMTYAANPATLADFGTDPRYTFIKGDIADPRPPSRVHFAVRSGERERR